MKHDTRIVDYHLCAHVLKYLYLTSLLLATCEDGTGPLQNLRRKAIGNIFHSSFTLDTHRFSWSVPSPGRFILGIH
jgi:hypothetical protein